MAARPARAPGARWVARVSVLACAALFVVSGSRVQADAGAAAAPTAAVARLDALALEVASARTAVARRRAAVLLAATSDPRAVAPLVDAVVTDSSAGVRLAAVRGLGSLGGHRACAALRFAAVADESRAVRRAAARRCASVACPPEPGLGALLVAL